MAGRAGLGPFQPKLFYGLQRDLNLKLKNVSENPYLIPKRIKNEDRIVGSR